MWWCDAVRLRQRKNGSYDTVDEDGSTNDEGELNYNENSVEFEESGNEEDNSEDYEKLGDDDVFP